MPNEDVSVPPGEEQGNAPKLETPTEEPWWAVLIRHLDYPITLAVLYAVGVIPEKLTELFAPEKLLALGRESQWLGNSLDQLDPWNLFIIYFSFLTTPAQGESGIWYILRGDFLPEGLPTYLWRIIPGVFYAASTLLSQSWINIITAAIAVGIGYAFVRKSDDPFLMNVLKVPAIGCVCLWILIKAMALTNWAFGTVLVGSNLYFYTASTGSLFSLMLKEREHHVTGLILKWIKSKGERT